MKKRNRMKWLYWLVLVVPLVLLWAVGAKSAIVRNATTGQTAYDSIPPIPLAIFDTIGNRVEFDTTADWGYIVVYYPSGPKAASDSFTIRGTNTPKILKDAAEYGGFAQFRYRRQISVLDGTPVNGCYTYEVMLRDSSLKLWVGPLKGSFDLYQTMTYSTFNDSLTNAITATNKANFRATGFADSMRDVIGDTFNVVSGGVFLSAAGNKSVADSVRDIFGDSTTSWKYITKGFADSTRDIVGDTFNVVSGGVFLSAAGNKSVADSVRDIFGDSTTAWKYVTKGLADSTRDIVGDSTTVWKYGRIMPDSVRDIFGDSTTSWKYVTKGLADSTRDIFGDSTTAWKYYAKGLADSMRDVVGDTFNVVSGGVFLAAAANKSVADSIRDVIGDSLTAFVQEVLDSLDTQAWASTSAGSGVDSAVVSRIVRRMWGIQLGAAGSTDSLTKAQRLAALPAATPDSVRDILGDSLATFGSISAIPDSIRDVFGDSTTTWKYYTKGLADSMRDVVGDTFNVVSGGVFLSAAGNKSVADSVRDIVGDSTTVWKYGRIMPDSVRDIFGDSTTLWKYVTKGLPDTTRDIFSDSLKAFKYEVIESLHSQTWAATDAGAGLNIDSVRDIIGDTARAYDATGGVTANLYPFMQVITTVDAAGTTATRQFVVDSTALGGSNEGGLVNKGITIRSDGTGLYLASGVIERVNCVAANCTLQVADALPFAVTSGDSIWIWGAEPAYVMATLAEASADNADSILARDTTGYGGDATIGGAIVAPAGDTASVKVMLTNMGLPVGLDSLSSLAETATAVGTLRRGEIVTARAAAETTMVILDRDSVLARGGIIDTVRYADTLGSQVASNCSSGGCPDSVGYAVTLVAYDSLTSAPVVSAQMAIRSSINGADLAVSPLTGVSGSFVFTIANAGTYYVITRAAGMTFPVRTLVVTGAQTDTVNGAGYSVSGHATVLGSVDCIGCDVRFVLESAGQSVTDTSTGYLITQTVVDTTTNGFGDFTMALPKTGNLLYTSGTIRKHPQWRVRISATDVEKEAKWDKLFDIPAESTQVHLSVVR